MAIKVISWALHLPLKRPTLKLVLLALADHADNDGVCWPSIKRLELFTGLSSRAIQRAIRELQKLSILTLTERPGSTTLYMIAMSGGVPMSPPAASHPPQAPIAVAGNTAMSYDWTPAAATMAAIQKEYAIDPTKELAKFRHHFIGTGARRKNWEATFRLWCQRSAEDFARPSSKRAAGSGADLVQENRRRLIAAADKARG